MVTLNNIFKVGIVGCGEISKAHLKAWNKLKDVRVTAVCDLNIQLAKDFANKWGVPSYYQDFITMLENEDFNILSVCTPPTVRSQIILPAVKRGIHVIVEKPFALTVSKANEMLEAAKKNRVKLCVVYNFLWITVVSEAISIVKEKKIGAVCGLDIRFISDGKDKMTQDKDHWCHRLPAGRFGEALPHPIYIAMEFLGDLELLSVYTNKLGGIPWIRDDEHRIILRSNNGSFVSIYSTLNSVRRTVYLDIYGTEGIIQADLRNNTLVVRRHRNPASFESVGLDTISFSAQYLKSYLINFFRSIRQQGPHKSIIESFVRSIRDDTTSPISEHKAREVVRIFEQVCRCIEE